MKRTLRIAAKNYHVWAGLSLGLLFCLMGLSGSVIVYRDAIEAALRPQWKSASHARPASVLVEADGSIRQRWPKAICNRVTFPRTPGEPFQYQIRVDDQPVHVYFDATTGEILGTFDLPWLDWIAGFHQNLRLPPTGRQLTGVIGIVLCLSSLSGLSIWLVRNPAWRDIFRVGWRSAFKKNGWTKLNFGLHRSTGLAANGFLLLLSLTGICLAFPNTFRAFAEMLTGTSAARPARITVAPSAMNQAGAMNQRFDTYVQTALGAVPGGVVRELRFPQSADRPVVVRIWHAGDYREDGSNQVSLEPTSARVLGVDAAANWSLARQVASIPAPVHYAEWGGPVVKALWCLTGLTPTLLFASGVFFWVAGFRARRKSATITRAETLVLTHR